MPTLTDVEPLAQALRDLTLGEPLAHGALTVVPLLAPGATDPGWLTLAEAGDAVTIEEVSEAGRLGGARDVPVPGATAPARRSFQLPYRPLRRREQATVVDEALHRLQIAVQRAVAA